MFTAHTLYSAEKQEISNIDCNIWVDQTINGYLNDHEYYLFLNGDGKLVVKDNQQLEAVTVCDHWEWNRTASVRCSDGYFSVLDNWYSLWSQSRYSPPTPRKSLYQFGSPPVFTLIEGLLVLCAYSGLLNAWIKVFSFQSFCISSIILLPSRKWVNFFPHTAITHKKRFNRKKTKKWDHEQWCAEQAQIPASFVSFGVDRQLQPWNQLFFSSRILSELKEIFHKFIYELTTTN